MHAFPLRHLNTTTTNLYHSPISERCDDETFRTSEELILVDKVDVGDGDNAAILVLHEVEPRLLQPLKVSW